jgi:tritrans,polycis-undecaprenyl-diphosphate synthase [geranylgeranyl-diphosphate specific]
MVDLQLPRHVGIICDGNRRFAKTLGDEIARGHEYGADKIEEVLDWCREIGIKNLTLWLFSIENFNRTPEELDALFKLAVKTAHRFADDKRTHEHKIRLNFVGDVSKFPDYVKEALDYALEKTKNYDNFHFNVAVGYGGKHEIVNAVKKIANLVKEGKLNPEDITKELFELHLYSANIPDVDLVIRTSGEQRTSGFLIWKTDYAEYYFTEKYWPELEKEDFINALVSYSERKRRFGK